MRVTKVTPFGKRKNKVFLAEGFAFVLYKEELCQWGIAEEEELGDEVFKRICREVLFPRAKEKALSLLEVQARTCCQIKERLLREGYPPAVTEQVAAFLTEYRLTDDLAFARNFIAANSRSKSRRQIAWELIQKGVGKETISQLFEEEEPQEEMAARRYLEKKLGGRKTMSDKEKGKLWAGLARRGFSADVIAGALRGMEEE